MRPTYRPSYAHQQQQDSRFQSNSSTYQPISPVPLNYDIKKDHFVNAAVRNNNLLERKAKVVRQDEQSND